MPPPPPGNGVLWKEGALSLSCLHKLLPTARDRVCPYDLAAVFSSSLHLICCSATKHSKNNICFSKLENGTNHPTGENDNGMSSARAHELTFPARDRKLEPHRKRLNGTRSKRQKPRPSMAKSCRKDNSPACQSFATQSTTTVSRLYSHKRLRLASLHVQWAGACTWGEEKFKDQKYSQIIALKVGIRRASMSDFNSKLFLISRCWCSISNALRASVQNGILQ